MLFPLLAVCWSTASASLALPYLCWKYIAKFDYEFKYKYTLWQTFFSTGQMFYFRGNYSPSQIRFKSYCHKSPGVTQRGDGSAVLCCLPFSGIISILVIWLIYTETTYWSDCVDYIIRSLPDKIALMYLSSLNMLHEIFYCKADIVKAMCLYLLGGLQGWGMIVSLN